MIKMCIRDRYHTDHGIRILSPQEKEVPTFIVRHDRLSGIDLMRINYNIALSRLSEDPGQCHNRKTPRCV